MITWETRSIHEIDVSRSVINSSTFTVRLARSQFSVERARNVRVTNASSGVFCSACKKFAVLYSFLL